MFIPPKRIKRGQKVAIVAPSASVHTDRLLEGVSLLKEVGLVPVLGPCVKNLKTDGMHSAPIDDRVQELNWAFRDPEIAAVICAIGGIGSAAVLPYLDYAAIRKSRKPLLGRSDITALNLGILRNAGLISINGQTPSIVLDKGEKFRELQTASFLNTLDLMMSNKNWASWPFVNNQHLPMTVSPGTGKGHVIGCNVDTLTRLLGTPHFPHYRGAILFIEDVHASVSGLARAFLHLKLAGILDQLSGVVIGEFCDLKGADEPDIEDVIQEYFSDGPPCVYGYSFSHGGVVAPIPVGATCSINADTGDVSFDFCMQ
jgi:muramoyltetrapeptide carboxypeptidase